MENRELPPSRWADVDGPLHYVEWDGPDDTTFVCLHGLGGFHVNWLAVGPGLAELGRVVAVDLPGFGLSPLDGRSARMRATAPILERFVRDVASGRVVLVGNSMGGSYALLLGALWPGLLDGTVLTCPALPWARGGWPAPIVAGAFAVYRSPGAGEWLVDQRSKRLSAKTAVSIGFRICSPHPDRIDPEVFDAHVEMVERRRDDPDLPKAFVEAARSLMDLGRRPKIAREVLDRAPDPILLLHGRHDHLVPLAWAQAAAAAHPSWRFRVFEDLGHVPMLEDPGRWLGAVRSWLEQDVEPASGRA